MKSKKNIIVLSIVVLLISQILLVGCGKTLKPSETLDLYKKYWRNTSFSKFTIV